MELKFRVDTKHRRDWFTEISFSHPAKMSLSLQLWIIDNYTKVGETILDPMAGSGTILVACSLGRNVIAIDLEQKFVDMMKSNWEKIKQRGSQLGHTFGQAQIICGDARQLENILCDKIITSPPYVAQISVSKQTEGLFKGRKLFKDSRDPQSHSEGQIGDLPYGGIDSIVTSPPYGGTISRQGGESKIDDIGISCQKVRIYSDNSNNLGNFSYGNIDSIITSPPYGASDVSQTHMTSDKRGDPANPNYRPSWKQKLAEGYAESRRPYHEIDSIITSPPYAEAQSGGGIAKHGYQGSKHSPTDLVGKRSYMPENIGGGNNISNLPYGQIDSIITSPSYEGSGFGQSNKYSGNVVNLNQQVVSRNRPANIARGKKARQIRYADQTDANLGNLQGDTYLQAMLTVYHSCFTVLKPQGLMILVIKNFIRNKKEVDLRGDTVRLCECVGFQFLEEHHRVLPGQSFWRTIYRRHHPDAPVIDREYILVFRR